MAEARKRRVLVTGAAGLVGQNLLAILGADPRFEFVGVDKHRHNLGVLRSLQPRLKLMECDLARSGPWEAELERCDAVVLLHAQIGGLEKSEFDRNNVEATRRVLDAAERAGRPYVVHVSSSVVNSQAVDHYTETKKAQEQLVRERGLKAIVLRPTLMFGWFDRKHLGWLAGFLKKAPAFPIPGNGRYLRQPLYAGDFAAIVASCLNAEREGAYNISGLEKIDYVDLIKELRRAVGARTPVVHVPYRAFDAALAVYAWFDKDPPFTRNQLKALTTPDVFEVIDWPGIFGVRATPLREALARTFRDARYAGVALQF